MSKSKKADVLSEKAKVNLDNNELEQAIVKAYFEIERIKERNKQQEKLDWQIKILKKDKPKCKNRTSLMLVNIYYDLQTFVRIMFIKKEDVPDGFGTTSLLKLILEPIFFILQLALYGVAIVFVYFTVISGISVAWGILAAIIAFIFARLIRITSFEIDNMKDKQYLLSIFTGVLSLGAIIIAIIALFVK